jgi:hypothetical protein
MLDTHVEGGHGFVLNIESALLMMGRSVPELGSVIKLAGQITTCWQASKPGFQDSVSFTPSNMYETLDCSNPTMSQAVNRRLVCLALCVDALGNLHGRGGGGRRGGGRGGGGEGGRYMAGWVIVHSL